MDTEHSTLRIHRDTKARLAKIGKFGESYDVVINLLLDIAEDLVEEDQTFDEFVEKRKEGPV